MSRAAGIVMLAVFSLMGHSAEAQERRLTAGVDFGAATTWDDEGMLGRGAAIEGHVAVAVNDRVTIRGVFDRVPYYRDTSWLRFDGSFDFFGGELERRFRSGTVQPFILGGGGVVRFSDIWIQKNRGSPLAPGTGALYSRTGIFGAAVAGTGLDIAISPRISIRPNLKVYMMMPDNDLFPAMSVRPGVGLTMRW
jgi:hypothetical protein